jgi:ParB-like chromosome segregation protein Spo0J
MAQEIKGARAPRAKAGAALTIVYREVATLRPYARNARTHGDEQIAQIAESMFQFGWTNPLLIDAAGGIIAGHGRLDAAKHLWAQGKRIRNCPKGKAPTITLTGLTKSKKRALILADNKIAENSGWDDDLLTAELAALQAADFDIGVIGFSEKEIDDLLGDVEPPDTSPGLGGLEYRIVVDCTSETHQTELLARFEKEGIACRALMS